MGDMGTSAVSAETQRGWSEQWSPLGGLAFAVGMIVFFFIGGGDTGESTEELLAFAEDEEGRVAATQIFALLSLGLVGWFVSGLHARVRRMSSQTAPALVLFGGIAFAVLFFLALTIWNAALIDFGASPGAAESRAAAYYLLEDIGWVTLGGAGIGAGLMAVAASLSALRSGVVAAWLGWIGVVLGILALGTIVFFGIFGWMLWFLIASIAMLARRS